MKRLRRLMSAPWRPIAARYAPADQRSNVDERNIRTGPSRSCEIARLPGRIEFSFESAQALKIVETAAIATR